MFLFLVGPHSLHLPLGRQPLRVLPLSLTTRLTPAGQPLVQASSLCSVAARAWLESALVFILGSRVPPQQAAPPPTPRVRPLPLAPDITAHRARLVTAHVGEPERRPICPRLATPWGPARSVACLCLVGGRNGTGPVCPALAICLPACLLALLHAPASLPVLPRF